VLRESRQEPLRLASGPPGHREHSRGQPAGWHPLRGDAAGVPASFLRCDDGRL